MRLVQGKKAAGKVAKCDMQPVHLVVELKTFTYSTCKLTSKMHIHTSTHTGRLSEGGKRSTHYSLTCIGVCA